VVVSGWEADEGARRPYKEACGDDESLVTIERCAILGWALYTHSWV